MNKKIAILYIALAIASPARPDSTFEQLYGDPNEKLFPRKHQEPEVIPSPQLPEYVYSPEGRATGYILPDSSNQLQLYDINNRWIGTIPRR